MRWKVTNPSLTASFWPILQQVINQTLNIAKMMLEPKPGLAVPVLAICKEPTYPSMLVSVFDGLV